MNADRAVEDVEPVKEVAGCAERAFENIRVLESRRVVEFGKRGHPLHKLAARGYDRLFATSV